MPALESSELDQICESVGDFAEHALQKAIDQARDPDKAVQFIARLQQELEQDCNQFSVAALCVVLGEARVEAAIPLLIQEATCEHLSLSQEAAAYALQRMGAPALEAAMRFLEAADDPVRRVLAYEILSAALDVDPELQTRVTEFCLKRAEVEASHHWPTEDWNPAMSVCTTLVRLGEVRVRSFLGSGLAGSESDEDREIWQLLLDELTQGQPPDWTLPWRVNWPEQCRSWAEEAEDLDKDARETVEASRHREADSRAEEFHNSRFAQQIEEVSAELAADDVSGFLHHGLDYVGLHFDACDPGDVSELLFEVYPRKISGEPEFFERFPRILEAFVEFLHETERLADPSALLVLLHEARTKLPRLAADPANWGMAKSVVMAGFEAGYDMTTKEGTNAWMLEYNLRMLRRTELKKAMEDLPDDFSVAPILRTEPRVGRNDPCPCGSGRKYKKCCGR